MYQLCYISVETKEMPSGKLESTLVHALDVETHTHLTDLAEVKDYHANL